MGAGQHSRKVVESRLTQAYNKNWSAVYIIKYRLWWIKNNKQHVYLSDSCVTPSYVPLHVSTIVSINSQRPHSSIHNEFSSSRTLLCSTIRWCIDFLINRTKCSTWINKTMKRCLQQSRSYPLVGPFLFDLLHTEIHKTHTVVPIRIDTL